MVCAPPTHDLVVTHDLVTHALNQKTYRHMPMRMRCSMNKYYNIYITFSHLADVFIQSDLQGCIHIVHLH